MPSQRLLFAVGPSLHLGKRVPGRGIDGVECHNVLTADPCDRSGEDRFHSRPLGDFAPGRGSDPCIRRLAHQGQRLAHPFVGNHVEERRLLQVDRQRFLQRSVEDSVACGIHEICQQDGVLLCDGLSSGRTEVKCSHCDYQNNGRDGHKNLP